MAGKVARDIPEGAVVNLGIGMPTLVGAQFDGTREVILQSENGLVGMGPPAAAGEEDFDVINASRVPVTLLPGGAYVHHADSFAMIRGGHVDYCILGAFQVSAGGDLANWHTGEADSIPAVGGAMDLAAGARQVYVMMEHFTRDGESKVVERLRYPATALACVDRIYTDLAVLDVTPGGLAVRDIVDGLAFDELVRLSGVPLADARSARRT